MADYGQRYHMIGLGDSFEEADQPGFHLPSEYANPHLLLYQHECHKAPFMIRSSVSTSKFR